MAVRAKICGITRPADAELAAGHGAAFVGVVFAWGPRVVSHAQAHEIVIASGPVPVMAVVDSPSAAELRELIEATGISGVQVNGRLDQAAGDVLEVSGLLRWNVAAIAAGTGLAATLKDARDRADAVLVEARAPGGAGGRGIALDRELAVAARRELLDTPMVLAGGLTPDNVAAAISLVGPDLVDVSSGIEISPGIKDRERVIRFLEAVRDAGSAAPDRR